MTQSEYLKALKRELSPLSGSERAKLVEYYEELIGDKIENGQTEEEIFAEFGSPKKLAEKILFESPEYEPKEKQKQKKTGKLSPGRIVGFSVLIPFVIIALATLYLLALSFILASFTMLLASIFRIVGTVVLLGQNFAVGLFSVGSVMAVFSIGFFGGFGTIKFVKLCRTVTVKIFKAYKKTFIREKVSI